MDALISLMIAALIYSVVYVVKKNFSVAQETAAAPVVDEDFPKDSILQSDSATPDSVLSEEFAREKPVKRSRPQEYSRVPGNKEYRSTVDQSAGKVASKEKRFGFSDKSEAKRAFIYSEILNRKYQ
jgi:hypothetical protein